MAGKTGKNEPFIIDTPKIYSDRGSFQDLPASPSEKMEHLKSISELHARQGIQSQLHQGRVHIEVFRAQGICQGWNHQGFHILQGVVSHWSYWFAHTELTQKWRNERQLSQQSCPLDASHGNDTAAQGWG